MNKLVSESLYEFQRGQEPKETLKIGGEYEKVKSWLSRFLYKSQWNLNEDWTIDIVKGDLIITGENIKEFPEFINFNEAHRDFLISGVSLEIMTGFPKIVQGDFVVSNNKLQILTGCPEYVGGDFQIEYNPGGFTEKQIRDICEVKGKVYL